MWLAIAPLTAPIAIIRAYHPAFVNHLQLTPARARVALIPNFPFFFCVWRSWSHYRGTRPHCLPCALPTLNDAHTVAYKASEYLEGFLRRGAIIPQSSPELDVIYAKYAPRQSASSPDAEGQAEKPSSPSPDPKLEDPDEDASLSAGTSLLLTKDAVFELQKALDVPEDSTFATDVCRALEQARVRLEGTRNGKTT